MTDTSIDDLPSDYSDRLIQNLQSKIVLVKYGGNAMRNKELKASVADDIIKLKQLGARPVIVHGGGPFIQQMLDRVGIESEFIAGHRKTSEEAMKYVEMVLRGQVNSDLVKAINSTPDKSVRAIGLSGKDGRLAIAKRRWHTESGSTEKIDLGQVGDVAEMDPKVIFDLLEDDLIPIVAPIAMGADKKDYNVNADMFAGHLAGALKAYAYVVLTDVQGLMEDKDRPETLYREIDRSKMDGLMNTVVQGGMIPKVESCLIALDKGVSTARIINGMQPHAILEELLTESRSGTLIH